MMGATLKTESPHAGFSHANHDTCTSINVMTQVYKKYQSPLVLTLSLSNAMETYIAIRFERKKLYPYFEMND